MVKVSLKNVWKVYHNARNAPPAVREFNLDIEDGEFIVFVGSSGCGKTTTLRMIAGLESITRGEIYIDGKLMNNVSPKNRNIAMVFQNYALYPNLNLFENMAFGLRLRKVEKYRINELVNQKSKQLQIEHLLERLPKDVSGGQRQRVALGRAIVRQPSVFLMDEPLSNLDAKMRVQMRSELIHLHRQLKATTIYVTHDQIEAMTMGDRIVVMDGGYIKQIGIPEEIYNNPANLYVAGFIGTPQANFIDGSIYSSDEGFFFTNNYMNLKIPDSMLTDSLVRLTKSSIVGGIRPEYLSYSRGHAPKTAENEFRAVVDMTELVGADKYVHVKYGRDIVTLRCSGSDKFDVGEKLTVRVNMDKFWFFNADGGQRIN